MGSRGTFGDVVQVGVGNEDGEDGDMVVEGGDEEDLSFSLH